MSKEKFRVPVLLVFEVERDSPHNVGGEHTVKGHAEAHYHTQLVIKYSDLPTEGKTKLVHYGIVDGCIELRPPE